MKSIVSYYYFWKTTDRYQIQKRHRMIEKQNDLKEVIVHLRSNGPPTAPRDLSGTAASSGEIPRSVFKGFSMTGPPAAPDGKGCESCFSELGTPPCYTHRDTHTHTHTHTHACAQTHTYIHTHTHKCTRIQHTQRKIRHIPFSICGVR